MVSGHQREKLALLGSLKFVRLPELPLARASEAITEIMQEEHLNVLYEVGTALLQSLTSTNRYGYLVLRNIPR